MNMSIEKMLSHVYEIEGLMLVTRRLGEENTPDVITSKIQRKVRELAEMCGVELTQHAPVAPAADTPQEPASEPVPQGEHLPEEDYDADETWQHDNGEEFKEVFSLNYEEPEHQPLDDGKVPVADREPDDDITVEFIMPDDEAPAAEQATEPAAPAAPATPQPPVFRKPIDTSDEPIEPAAPLRVEQKLQRDLSKDIRKAFSVNDRFRFQRELFAGSASAMNTALEHIEVMTSYGNAELYFYSQLHWDRDNENVKDFMEIVRNHFH